MTSPTDFDSQKLRIDELCQNLKSLELANDVLLAKQRAQLLGESDVYRWFVAEEYGGFGWDTEQILLGYLELSKACLSTAFVLTQRSGAVKRISTSGNSRLKQSMLPDLAAGNIFSTVGISHLTTSRRHLGKPVLQAEKVDDGYILDGFSPWVTGVTFADSVIVGACLVDHPDPELNDAQILINVSTDLKGVSRPDPAQLVALTDSCTGQIRLDKVFVEEDQLVDGPVPNVMNQGSGGSTGGLQTSTLAIGLSKAAIDYIEQESQVRDGISLPLSHLQDQWQATYEYLFSVAKGENNCTNEQLRIQSNSLVLRSTQAALMVAKGVGYCKGHPVGRWCQEALFFLVWSCPQAVADSNLCELAQVTD